MRFVDGALTDPSSCSLCWQVRLYPLGISRCTPVQSQVRRVWTVLALRLRRGRSVERWPISLAAPHDPLHALHEGQRIA